MPINQKLTDEQRQLMVDEYLAGSHSNDLAQKYGIASSNVRKAVLKSGNAMRGNAEAKRVYSFTAEYFSVIDTEEKAYWVGFISADGCVTKKGLIIGLKISDMGHLEKLKASLDYTGKVSDRGNYCQLCVSSQALALSLVELGIPFRKSLVLEPCTKIPDHLIRHYWRGLIDGDGNIQITAKKLRRGKPEASIGIVGSFRIVDQFKSIGQIITGRNPSLRARGNVFEVKFSGNQSAFKLVDWLYKDATIYLDRKYAQYLEVNDLNASLNIERIGLSLSS